jgi:hypothetical protein
MDTTPNQTPEMSAATTLQAPEPHVLLAPVPWYKRQSLVVAILASVLLLVGASYYVYTKQNTVAVVNGTRITKAEFNESVRLITESVTAQGIDVTDEVVLSDIQKQALEVLINNTLLVSAAKESGIVVTDADIQEKYELLVAKFPTPEEFTKNMTDAGFTEASFRVILGERMYMDKYIESVTDIETVAVTDEEIKNFITANTPAGTTPPPIEEIRAGVESHLLGVKQQEIVGKLLTDLRAESVIETNI